jgi:hypothetical protein
MHIILSLPISSKCLTGMSPLSRLSTLGISTSVLGACLSIKATERANPWNGVHGLTIAPGDRGVRSSTYLLISAHRYQSNLLMAISDFRRMTPYPRPRVVDRQRCDVAQRTRARVPSVTRPVLLMTHQSVVEETSACSVISRIAAKVGYHVWAYRMRN